MTIYEEIYSVAIRHKNTQTINIDEEISEKIELGWCDGEMEIVRTDGAVMRLSIEVDHDGNVIGYEYADSPEGGGDSDSANEHDVVDLALESITNFLDRA